MIYNHYSAKIVVQKTIMLVKMKRKMMTQSTPGIAEMIAVEMITIALRIRIQMMVETMKAMAVMIEAVAATKTKVAQKNKLLSLIFYG